MITARQSGTGKELAEALRAMADKHEQLHSVAPWLRYDFTIEMTVITQQPCLNCGCPIDGDNHGHWQGCPNASGILEGEARP